MFNVSLPLAISNQRVYTLESAKADVLISTMPILTTLKKHSICVAGGNAEQIKSFLQETQSDPTVLYSRAFTIHCQNKWRHVIFIKPESTLHNMRISKSPNTYQCFNTDLTEIEIRTSQNLQTGQELTQGEVLQSEWFISFLDRHLGFKRIPTTLVDQNPCDPHDSISS
jgi:hypothetical protein